MTYKLALKLKNAGFPQENCDFYFHGVRRLYYRESGVGLAKLTVGSPTLSELIKACGEGFYGIRVWSDTDDKIGYQAMDDWHSEEEHCGMIGATFGSTPEEAVAKLWLEINKK